MSPSTSKTFEVETRFHFANQAEVFHYLPFLEACFTQENCWKTTHYGRVLFQQDILLRISESQTPESTRFFLGWKGQDTGSFANIRAELDEETTTKLHPAS